MALHGWDEQALRRLHGASAWGALSVHQCKNMIELERRVFTVSFGSPIDVRTVTFEETYRIVYNLCLHGGRFVARLLIDYFVNVVARIAHGIADVVDFAHRCTMVADVALYLKNTWMRMRSLRFNALMCVAWASKVHRRQQRSAMHDALWKLYFRCARRAHRPGSAGHLRAVAEAAEFACVDDNEPAVGTKRKR
jgi:hypothetical protein